MQGFSSINIGGNPVPQVSLLAPGATPQNSPKSIGGAERDQIMLCDPLTGEPLDFQSHVENAARNIFVGIPSDGTIDAIRVMFDFVLTDVYTVMASGDTLVTVYKNDSPVDAGITTSGVEAHQTYSVAFAAGDKMSVVLTNTGSGSGGLEVAIGVSRIITG
jgi:hypothetical protein